jgi:integrative and conjugative element protein (TIGR02256 family)
MMSDAKSKYPLETGGCLLGYTAQNGDIVITDFIDAGPNAKHERLIFEPDYKYQSKVMSDKYDAEPVSYLGDWHTHPDGEVAMSGLDWKCMDQIKDSDAALCDNPVIVIIGDKDFSASSAFLYSTQARHGITLYEA